MNSTTLVVSVKEDVWSDLERLKRHLSSSLSTIGDPVITRCDSDVDNVLSPGYYGVNIIFGPEDNLDRLMSIRKMGVLMTGRPEDSEEFIYDEMQFRVIPVGYRPIYHK